MRKLILYSATSLDGKIASPDGSIDWLPDPTEEDYGYKEFYDSVDTVVMGYKTYEKTLTFGEWSFNGKESFVFSRNPGKKVVREAELVNVDPVEFVKGLKRKPGKDIWLVGGGEINTLLHNAKLIDEYILAYIPVLLGEGLELFPDIKTRVDLKIRKSKVYPNGLVLLYLSPKTV